MVKSMGAPLVAAGLLILGVAAASAQQWQAEPRYGTVDLSGGFSPDPYSVRVVAGGSDSADHLGSTCSGNIDSSRPDVDLNFTAGDLPLSIYVESEADTTLVVYDPRGRWYCNDDFGGDAGLNPGLVFNNPTSGNYNIWVGTFASGSFPEATLKISELEPRWETGQRQGGGGAAGIVWGDNTSRWADDGECDDPRFAGPGVAVELVEEDRFHDANDCRRLYEQGQIYLRQ